MVHRRQAGRGTSPGSAPSTFPGRAALPGSAQSSGCWRPLVFCFAAARPEPGPSAACRQVSGDTLITLEVQHGELIEELTKQAADTGITHGAIVSLILRPSWDTRPLRRKDRHQVNHQPESDRPSVDCLGRVRLRLMCDTCPCFGGLGCGRVNGAYRVRSSLSSRARPANLRP